MALPGASSRFAAAIFGYLSCSAKGDFPATFTRPRKAASVPLGGRQDPPACSAPRQPGDSPAPALLLPAQGGSWWPPSAKVRLDHPSLLVSWVWACMGNERRPDATSRLFFSFSLRFKGKKPSLETRRQIITIKLICKLSWIFVLYPGKSCLKSVYLVFFLTSQHVFIVQNANLTLTSKFG